MAEYIEREALLADLRGSYEELRNIYNGLKYDEERRICCGELATFMECIMRLKEAPTADVVEVVRCRDCRHFTTGYCCRDIKGRSQMHYMGENAFCSYGAKMDGKGEGE